jgi:hypothetical protein
MMYKADYQRELAVVEVERFDWLPLGAYLHVADKGATEVLVVGVPDAGAAVMLVG